MPSLMLLFRVELLMCTTQVSSEASTHLSKMAAHERFENIRERWPLEAGWKRPSQTWIDMIGVTNVFREFQSSLLQ